MNNSWKKYMKVGLVHFMAFPEVQKGNGPILETLKLILADDFFDVVEITTINDLSIRQKVREMLVTSKVTVAYGSQPVQLANKLNLNSFNDQERSYAVERCLACVDEAVEIGAVGIAFLSGSHPGNDKRVEATNLLFDSFSKICAHATSQDTNLKVVLETFDFDIDKKALIGPNSEAVEFSQRIRESHNNFGLMLDLSHLPLQRESIEDALSIAREHIVHAHMGNCVVKDANHFAYGDQHPRFGIEGGENDVEEVVNYIRMLIQIGYLKENEPRILSFEVKPVAGEASEIVIANAKRTLREAWELV